ncbi:tRNA (guanine(26)-N(2))-dimethyltransferase-like [Oopsacas minuta]|uniref:tRNA (guanine(26)-N(2))-dimethyltransferase n=1 Tax=Oopsacas minuta TaxID=111878 RepID=A0AAV7KG97_9METZ|nr:tRNA (guanine(26)-N(2))-dimethyltransferase-like [Oopsacas minuta]
MATNNPQSDETDKTDKNSRIITEGRAKIVLPPGVFYNPVQEFNRDLTVAVINEFSKIFYRDGIGRKATANSAKREGDNRTYVADGEDIPELRILDALSATGLRAIRYALEVKGRLQITANDIDSTAVEVIKQNSELNKMSDKVVPVCNDAALLMHRTNGEVGRYHVVDLDPYGSPSPFLDTAVQAVEYGGLLCVTCTDMAVLCGRASTTCYAKYGSTSIPNTPHIHETALRIILSTVSSHANRYGRYIQPMLSVSIDFYARIFVRSVQLKPRFCPDLMRAYSPLLLQISLEITYVFLQKSKFLFLDMKSNPGGGLANMVIYNKFDNEYILEVKYINLLQLTIILG